MTSPEQEIFENLRHSGFIYNYNGGARLSTGLPNMTLLLMNALVERQNLSLSELIGRTLGLTKTWHAAEKEGGVPVAVNKEKRTPLVIQDLPEVDLPPLIKARSIDVSLLSADASWLAEVSETEQRSIRDITAQGVQLYVDILRVCNSDPVDKPQIVIEYPDFEADREVLLHFDTTLL